MFDDACFVNDNMCRGVSFSSIFLAGLAAVFRFDRSGNDDVSRVVIDCDCNVYVLGSEVMSVEDFDILNYQKELYLVELYRLIGCNLVRAEVVFGDVLKLFVGGKFIYFVPDSRYEFTNSWVVYLEMKNGGKKLIVRSLDGDFFVNKSDGFFSVN